VPFLLLLRLYSLSLYDLLNHAFDKANVCTETV